MQTNSDLQIDDFLLECDLQTSFCDTYLLLFVFGQLCDHSRRLTQQNYCEVYSTDVSLAKLM